MLAAHTAVSSSGYEEHENDHLLHHREPSTRPPLNPTRLHTAHEHDADDFDVNGDDANEVEVVDGIDIDAGVEVPIEDDIDQHADEVEDDVLITHGDRTVKHVSEDLGSVADSVNQVDSVGSSMPSSRGLAMSSPTRLIDVEASEISDDIHSSSEPKSALHHHHGSSEEPYSSFVTASAATVVSTSTATTNNLTTHVDGGDGDKNEDDDDKNDESNNSSEANAFFDADPVVGVAFDSVGADETKIPDAPTNILRDDNDSDMNIKDDGGLMKGGAAAQKDMWDNLQQRIRSLQQSVSSVEDEKRSLRRKIDALAQRRKADEVLIESLRLRATEANSVSEHATRQLKDTRRRMARRLRDLEEQLVAKDTQHTDELYSRKQVEKQLRHELDIALASSAGTGNSTSAKKARESRSSARRSKAARGANVAVTTPSSSNTAAANGAKVSLSTGQSASMTALPLLGSASGQLMEGSNHVMVSAHSFTGMGMHMPSDMSMSSSIIPVAAIGNADVSARAAAAVGRANSLSSSEPGRMRKGRADIPAPAARTGTVGRAKMPPRPLPAGRKMMNSLNNANVNVSKNNECVNTTASSGGGRATGNDVTGSGAAHATTRGTPNKSTWGGGGEGEGGGGAADLVSLGPIVESRNLDSKASVKTVARRSLIRRALIAHIQSTRYRSARMAWFDFFGAEGNHISYELFAKAVRSLAVAADARDRDLELLLEEVCSLESSSVTERKKAAVVSWAMFARFYQKTKSLENE